jgi:hypothetical protein
MLMHRAKDCASRGIVKFGQASFPLQAALGIVCRSRYVHALALSCASAESEESSSVVQTSVEICWFKDMSEDVTVSPDDCGEGPPTVQRARTNG